MLSKLKLLNLTLLELFQFLLERKENMFVNTSTIDKLFLELSQFTNAKTHKELQFEEDNSKLRATVLELNREIDRLKFEIQSRISERSNSTLGT